MGSELMRIRQQHHLTSQQVAEAAGLPLRVEYLCEIGAYVEEEDVHKILTALARLTGCLYSQEDLQIQTRDPIECLVVEQTRRIPLVKHYRKGVVS